MMCCGPSIMTGRIAAILGVRDEVELIGASIAHLQRIGVDHVCVVDYGSTDGTLDIVRAAQRTGAVSLSHANPDIVVDYAASSDHDLAIARATGAEWVFPVDPDEFWLPATGSLRTSAIFGDADVVIVGRYNVALTDRGLSMPRVIEPSQYHRLELFTRRVPHFRRFIAEHPDVPFITVAPGRKAVGRLAKVAAILPGGHDLASKAPDALRQVARDVVVAHLPFTTWTRFVRKVADIRDELNRHPALFEGDYAWHWRRWAELDEGGLRLEFQRQVANRARLAEWRDEGILQTAADLLGLPTPAASGLAARLLTSAGALATRAGESMLGAMRPPGGRLPMIHRIR
jgi:glycosyltransferase involved in cell wall biosynthesis